MVKPETVTRKIRPDLTTAEKARLEKYALSFKSIRRVDMRVEKFVPSRTQRQKVPRDGVPTDTLSGVMPTTGGPARW